MIRAHIRPHTRNHITSNLNRLSALLDFYLQMDGSKDLVSGNYQTDTSAGAAYYIHPTTGELVTVSAGEPLIHPTLGNVSLPTFEQVCRDSEDPGEWRIEDATKAPTGNVFGPFPEYAITDSGSSTARVYLWQMIVSGIPTVKRLYFNLRYNAGTSGEIYFLWFDGSVTSYKGTIGASTITNTTAIITVFSDEYSDVLGYRQLKGMVEYTSSSTTAYFRVGPNSTDNSSILVLGADVSEDRAILDFHVPSSGSNVTIASRAGTTKLPNISTSFPKFYGALVGLDGNPAEAKHTLTWTSGHDYDVSGAAAGIILKSGNFEIGYDATGGVTLTDGTNTATVAGVNWSSGDEVAITATYGPNTIESSQKMQLTVDASSSALTACLDTMGPGDDFIWGDIGTTVQNGVSGYAVTKLLQTDWVA